MDRRAKIRILSEKGGGYGTRLFIDGQEQFSVGRIEIGPIALDNCNRVTIEYVAPSLDIEMATLYSKGDD